MIAWVVLLDQACCDGEPVDQRGPEHPILETPTGGFRNTIRVSCPLFA